MLCPCPSERLKAYEVLRKYILNLACIFSQFSCCCLAVGSVCSIGYAPRIVLGITKFIVLYWWNWNICLPGHPWICENGVATDQALDPSVLSRLKQFSAMNKLKKLALRVSILFTSLLSSLYCNHDHACLIELCTSFFLLCLIICPFWAWKCFKLLAAYVFGIFWKTVALISFGLYLTHIRVKPTYIFQLTQQLMHDN